MSLAGIAISIGVLVDGAIVEVENAYKKLEHWERTGRQGGLPPRASRRAQGSRAVRVFFSLLVIAVASCRSSRSWTRKAGCSSRWPGRRTSRCSSRRCWPSRSTRRCACCSRAWSTFRFRPRWLARLANAVAGRQDPLRGEAPDQPRPVPALRAGLPLRAALEVAGHRAAPSLMVVATVPVYLRLGSEFMPPLNEGTLLYMPTTLPGHVGRPRRSGCCRRRTDPQQFPGGRARVRQGRPRRDVHRPGAVLDDGDGRRPEAARAVAARTTLVLATGRRSG